MRRSLYLFHNFTGDTRRGDSSAPLVSTRLCSSTREEREDGERPAWASAVRLPNLRREERFSRQDLSTGLEHRNTGIFRCTYSGVRDARCVSLT